MMMLYSYRLCLPILAVVVCALAGGFNPAQATVFGADDRRPVFSLKPDDRYRALSRPIGHIETESGDHSPLAKCTAAVISPTQVLTTSFCFGGDTMGRDARFATLYLGLRNHGGPGATFELKLPPVEINDELGYAVVEVAGNPANIVGTARLLVRRASAGEQLFVFNYAESGEDTWINVADNCTVRGVQDGYIAHDCDTSAGSSGALLFSRDDEAVIGMHSLGGSSDFKFNRARPMRDIWAASQLVAAVAWSKEPPPQAGEKQFAVTLDDDALDEFRPNQTVKLNGREHRVAAVERDKRRVTFLGDGKDMLKGLNSIAAATRQFDLWNAENVLSRFASPYKTSYAVIAAIDDYDRDKDPLKRGKTGYPKLTDMVTRAEELKRTLIGVGFAKDNILTFYDEQATARALDDTLGEFWQGGKYADADRLFVYFGGHGDGERGNGFLVTYDFDPKRPTRSGFLMSRFANENFANIKAKHVLVALDSCGSGMAVPGSQSLGGEGDESKLETIATLTTIAHRTREKARNMLVAGTGEQKALWETGGIFTQALIEGLSGKADLISDGVIQFEELALHISRMVSARAEVAKVTQDPRAFIASSYGSGTMLFMLPERGGGH